jgi:hypothetical protein
MTGNNAEIVAAKCNNAALFMEIVAQPQQIKTSGYSYMNTVECESISVQENDPEKHTISSLPVTGTDDFFIFTLPEVPGGANSWALPYLTQKRSTTLEIPYPITETYSYTLCTIANLEFINQEMAIEKKNALGTVNIHIEKRALNYYQVTRNLNLRKSIITPAEYGAFLELMSVWRETKYRTVMFR